MYDAQSVVLFFDFWTSFVCSLVVSSSSSAALADVHVPQEPISSFVSYVRVCVYYLRIFCNFETV